MYIGNRSLYDIQDHSLFTPIHTDLCEHTGKELPRGVIYNAYNEIYYITFSLPNLSYILLTLQDY